MKTSSTIIVAALLLFTFLPTGHGQTRATWRCELPGGTYNVALASITAISQHQYLLDGVQAVTEVTIDTNGSSLARFYFVEPVSVTSPLGVGQSLIDTVQEKLKEGTEKVAPTVNGQPIWAKVIKNYPTTTHARTVEFRLESKGDAEKLLASVESAWKRGLDTSFKLTK